MENKKQKKLTRRLLRIDEKQDIILTFLAGQLFMIFWLSLFFDIIAGKFLTTTLRYNPDFGWWQLYLSGLCLYFMLVLRKAMK